MRREQHIPLFLWVTTAIVVHLVGGEGATKVVERLEETLDIRSFASDVRAHAKTAGAPLEVSLVMDETAPENDEAIEETELDDQLPESDDESDPPPDTTEEPEPEKAEELKEAPIEKPAEVEKEPEKEKVAEKPAEKDKVPDLELPKPQKPPPAPNKRVAVDQHVEDKNQDDNPNAEFAGDEANHVKEETVARNTANDTDSAPATMGGPSGGVGEEPGNSDKDKLAQSSESEGRKDRVGGDPQPASERQAAQAAAAASATPPPASPASPARAPAPSQAGQTAQESRAATQSQEHVADTVATPGGSYAVAKPQEASAAQRAQRAREARAGAKQQSPTGMLGLGSRGVTQNGVNLNLSFQAAKAIVGADAIASLQKAEGERRLSEHRGKWQSMGLEKWKPALENYVSSVKPGNQTALNTARVPFARYLNHIHQRLHEIYAHDFLGHLDQLPADHPLNNREMSTHLEIALSREDGRIVKMGITKSSGVTAFDVGALESVEKAGPYGSPPGAIVSEDGNVYLHWEFHRRPEYACSTYFARPFIITGGQKSAPPRVEPPPRPTEEEKTKRDERSGSIDKQESRATGNRG